MMFRRLVCGVLPRMALAICLGTTSGATAQAEIWYTNVEPASAAKLRQAVGEVPLESGLPDATRNGGVIIWQASASRDISPEQAKRIGEYVQNGGALLLTLDRNTGVGPFRLAFMLPTTAWRTLINVASRGNCDGEVGVADWDRAIYPGERAPLMRLPFYHRLKPLDAVERGRGRYERFARKQPYIDLDMKPWDAWFTRPLINRDWKTWIRADDVERSSLLLTGRYGAGRVAVFASSLDNAPQSMLTPLLSWLREATPAGAAAIAAGDVSATATADVAQRKLRVTIENRSDHEVSLLVLARVLTWENALIGDQSQPAKVPAKSSLQVRVPLPARGPEEYQAISQRDAYFVRLGILTADGSRLLSEQRVSADLRPAVKVALSTDNLWAMPYPFHAPDYDAQDRCFLRRMGEPVMAYAYPEDHPIRIAATLSNGLSNLAPLATAKDLTDPANPTAAALNDGIVHAEKGPRGGLVAYGAWEGAKGVDNTLQFDLPRPMTLCAVVLNGCPSNYRGFLKHNIGQISLEADGTPIAHATDLGQHFEAGNGLVRIPFAPVEAKSLKLTVRGVDDNQKPWLGEVEVQGAEGALPATTQGHLQVTLVDPLQDKQTILLDQHVALAGGEIQTVNASVSLKAPPAGVEPFRLEGRFMPDTGQTATAQVPLMVLKPQRALEPKVKADPPDAVHLGFIVTRGFRNALEVGTGTRESTGAWSTPDDLVWAYARQLKQTSAGVATKAATMYASDQDTRHYSTPWTHFPNGEGFFTLAAPGLVDKARQNRQWDSASCVVLGFSDRWDTGPSTDSMYTWPEMIAFDDWLAEQGQPRLRGKTRREVADEINQQHRGQWLRYLAERYIGDVRTLRDAFAAAGKELIINAQGIPLVPTKYQGELAQVIRGMSSDCTWGLRYESPAFTTGEQMATLSLNSEWKLAEPLVWGYDSAILNNPYWYSAVGTTEPSRRFQYDRAWRGLIGEDGNYRSMTTYGYSMNASVSWCMNAND